MLKRLIQLLALAAILFSFGWQIAHGICPVP